MFCLICKNDRNSKDYYKSNICYKCLYIEKTNANKKEKTCRVCDQKLPQGRWIFCSYSCSEKNEYESWTRKVKFPSREDKHHPWKDR